MVTYPVDVSKPDGGRQNGCATVGDKPGLAMGSPGMRVQQSSIDGGPTREWVLIEMSMQRSWPGRPGRRAAGEAAS